MKTILTTRHPATVQWLARQGIAAEQVDHVSSDSITHPVKLIGNVPPAIAAQVCQQGGEYWHIDLDLPQTIRGKELSVSDLEQYKAKIIRYHIEQITS